MHLDRIALRGIILFFLLKKLQSAWQINVGYL